MTDEVGNDRFVGGPPPGGPNGGTASRVQGGSSSGRSGGGGGKSSSRPRMNMNSAGQDFDYSGGNLKYGTGKYQQRENDGYTGGVNLSSNGRSMQHNIYTGGRDPRNGPYGRYGDDDDDTMMMYDDDLMYDDGMMMMDDAMMMGGRYANDMYGGGDMDRLYYEDQRRRGVSGGGGIFRVEDFERAGRGGPRAYSNARNGGYTVNGRSHQFNSRMDERRRYSNDFYYGDDEYFASRYGDNRPGGYYYEDYNDGPDVGGPGIRSSGSSGLLRDMMF
jgi:hypothetical protein